MAEQLSFDLTGEQYTFLQRTGWQGAVYTLGTISSSGYIGQCATGTPWVYNFGGNPYDGLSVDVSIPITAQTISSVSLWLNYDRGNTIIGEDGVSFGIELRLNGVSQASYSATILQETDKNRWIYRAEVTP